MSSASLLVSPLTKAILPAVPWYIRWSGDLNNRWNQTTVGFLLQERDERLIAGAWKAVSPNDRLIDQVLAAIGKEVGWKLPRFVPQDECFIVMKMWWHGLADCLERERCLWAIEAIRGKRLPRLVLPPMADMTLGELLTYF
jgi:hypothetical protein